jgi:flagellar basal body-associated protein FliL
MNKKKKIIIIVASVVFVLVGVGIGFYIWSQQDRVVTKEDKEKAKEVAEDDEMLRLMEEEKNKLIEQLRQDSINEANGIDPDAVNDTLIAPIDTAATEPES